MLIFLLWIFYKNTQDQKYIPSFFLFFKKSIKSLFQFSNIQTWVFWFFINTILVSLLWGNGVNLLFFMLRFFEILIICQLFKDRILPLKKTIHYLLIGAGVQVLWAVGQFALNGSLGLYFLGESKIAPDILGVAKINGSGGQKWVRSYGSFLHPNILATYLTGVIFIILTFFKSSVKKRVFIGILTLGLVLTFSRSALITTFLGVVLYFLSQKNCLNLNTLKWFGGSFLIAINLLFFINHSFGISSEDSTNDRFQQIEISQSIAQSRPFGIGVDQFTAMMQSYSDQLLRPWQKQPVHNSYALILNETGWQGFMILVVILALVWKRIKSQSSLILLFSVLLLASFDHLWWTSWVGVVLIGLMAGYAKIRSPINQSVNMKPIL